MQQIHIAIAEIKRVLFQVSSLEALLQSCTVYMGSLFFCILFGVPYTWAVALIPALGFFVFELFRLGKKFSLKLVEQKVPPLHEQLRTAHDNLHRDNPVVQSLQLDVMRNLRFCRTSYFIPFKSLLRHILAVTVFAFLILILAAYNVQFLHYQNIMQVLEDLTPEEPPMIFEDQGQPGEFTDIFGNESIAELGREELNLQINPVLSEININEVKPPEEREFKESAFPEEIAATTDTSFDEDIPKEHKKIIKRYFQQIAES